MDFLELFLIAIGLSMDAVAVCMTNGMAYQNNTRTQSVLTAVSFGFFQGAMPLAGFYLGGVFSYYINRYSGMVIFIILGFIGGKMVIDGFGECTKEKGCGQITYSEMMVQSVATSIDAFAVGVGFCAVNVNIFSASATIAVTTAVLSLIAVYIGKQFGNMLGKKAEIMGGIILVGIGIKALLF